MQRFKKIGVFLHDSPGDETALAYAGVIATCAQSEHVLCVHVQEPSSTDATPDIADLEQEVLCRLPEPIAKKTEFRVHSGAGVPEILRAARDLELDLLVVGRRLPSEQIGIGSAFARLARKAPCSVLVVPAHAHPHLERLFVPVDFSDYARLALDQALGIAAASDGSPQVVVHTNFEVGYGYRKLGLTLSEAVRQREKVALDQLREFTKDLDAQQLNIELVATSSEDLERAIIEVAVARKMDVIVLGGRGESSHALLGSTTERLLMQSVLPILVVKKKGETASIIDALFGSG